MNFSIEISPVTDLENLPKLKSKDLMGLNVEVKASIKDKSKSSKGIF